MTITDFECSARQNVYRRVRQGLTGLLLPALLLITSSALADTVLLSEELDNTLGQFSAEGYAQTTGYGVRLRGSRFGQEGQITSEAIDTRGYYDLTLTFNRITSGLDAGESGQVHYSLDGYNFMLLDSTQSASGLVSLALPSDAENQESVYLRFSVEADSYFDRYLVSNMELFSARGEPGCEPDCGGEDPGEPEPPVDPGDDNPLARGPDPTNSSLMQQSGPFSVASESISSFSADGFGGATIYYPSGEEGPFAVIAISPGYLGRQSSIRWWGNLLASHGFVAVTIDTESTSDYPSQRADQLLAALTQVSELGQSSGPLQGLIDPERMGVMGHSMGGGGALVAADRGDSRIKAAIPMAPWNINSNFSSMSVPTLVMGCENDTVAAVRSNARAFYSSFPTNLDRAYLEVNNGSHMCVLSDSGDNVLGKYGVSWMKRFLDNDERYSRFLCGEEHQQQLQTSDFSDYRESCPY